MVVSLRVFGMLVYLFVKPDAIKPYSIGRVSLLGRSPGALGAKRTLTSETCHLCRLQPSATLDPSNISKGDPL